MAPRAVGVFPPSLWPETIGSPLTRRESIRSPNAVKQRDHFANKVPGSLSGFRPPKRCQAHCLGFEPRWLRGHQIVPCSDPRLPKSAEVPLGCRYGDRHVVCDFMPIRFQARWLRIETKRQQAAALQTLRAYQRPLHPRRRVRNYRDRRAFPCDGVVGQISQPGVAEGPGGVQGPGALPVRRLWFRHAGLGNMRAKPCQKAVGM